ncbi:uncharacterized protein B0H18DRAFT_432792 [Fomitopsis serialis]|uniref:uncharacterized protein n=1 Tax=Fomitopsis serialis TaxID=139415 RepID=UPI0020080856|nr:uncharacterized protein B0H18DRAFT_432792 [Neoantrodia serialis]KAH9924465.1 hypothetical protein B0H18DRAFT_432792 [Neoantrodia serialis]
MAASRAFQIEDIIEEILDHLYPWDGVEYLQIRERRKTLASCARVDKFVHDIALDVLWRSMHDLRPLLKVLPAFQQATVHKDYRGRDTTEYTLLGRLSSEDLHRFQLYARRIISLDITRSPYLVRRHSSVLLSLSRALGHQPLLPRLRTLAWTHYNVTDHDVLYFVSPSLRSLTFHFTGASGAVVKNMDSVPCRFLFEALCEQVAAAVPCLEKLSVLSEASPYCFIPFGKCGGLREVTIGGHPSQCAYLGVLSSLDNLTKLDVRHVSELGQDVVHWGSHGFRALKVLCVRGNPRSIGSVLMAFATSDITLLEVTIDPCDRQTATDLLNIIKSQFNAALHKLELLELPLQSAHGGSGSPLHPIPLMLGFHNLHTVSLSTWSKIAFSDEDLCTLASAWANIFSLHIRWMTAEDVVMARPTLDCLPRIARSCPHLRRLDISSMNLTFAAGLDTYPILSHQLDYLDIHTGISNSQKTDVMDVALFLDRLFPFLDAKKLRKLYIDEQPWLARVYDRLQGLHAVRMQDTKRMVEGNV